MSVACASPDILSTAAPQRLSRIEGLDAIRFVCALWVVMAHLGGPPILGWLDRDSAWGRIIHGLYGNAFCGVAAVMAFFVISGICIHFPHMQKGRIPVMGEYFVRRFVRIGIPMGVGWLLAWPLQVDLHGLIFWSLYAELIYYTVYPGLLALRRRGVTWSVLVGVTFAGALGVVLAHPGAGNFHEPGILFTWLLGMPCWILGCLLAEKSQLLPAGQAKNRIWWWRGGVWVASSLCSVLRFHTPLGYPWTLPLFGVLVYFWLLREVRHFRDHPAPRWLEWGGAWSYSLYVVHMLAHAAALHLPGIDGLRGFPHWAIHILMVLIISYLFALAVEFPSHHAAKWMGLRMRLWSQTRRSGNQSAALPG